MESNVQNKSIMKPLPLSQLLPGLSGILNNDVHSLTSRKQPRNTMAFSQTTEKHNVHLKPLNMAQMRADILALKGPSPKKQSQQTSAMKKKWNSSSKVDQKKTFHTADGKNLKHASVRKVLNFQPKPRTQPSINPRSTLLNRETPKFVKPEPRTKKSMLPLQGKNSVRISGVYSIPETPIMANTRKFPITQTIINKENISKFANMNRKSIAPQNNNFNRKRIVPPPVPDTPMSNTSSDASFLQREKDIEQKDKIECTLEDIVEVSPPVSTPFKNYRSVQEYFNDSSAVEDSADKDNTIMCLNNPSICVNDNNKREESVIVSLCDLLSKATVTDTTKMTKEFNDLVEMENQIINNIELIQNGLDIMTKIKNTQEISLHNIRKLIQDTKKGCKTTEHIKEKTLVVEQMEISVKLETMASPVSNPVAAKCSVIKSCGKSPNYKIPKKNTCLRKKVFHKSMPTVLDSHSPEPKIVSGDRAMSMYLKMKEKMNFLSTPVSKETSEKVIPNTPAVTSHNLRRQLDKLYNNS